MGVIFDIDGEIMIARLSGEIDHHSVEKIRKDMDKHIKMLDVKCLVFDFAQVSFMDSSGIGMVLGRNKLLLENGGKAYITGCKPLVEKILHMAGVFTVIDKLCGTGGFMEERR